MSGTLVYMDDQPFDSQTAALAAKDTSDESAEFRALQTIIYALRSLSDEAQRRILDSASTFLKIRLSGPQLMPATEALGPSLSTGGRSPAFSKDTSLSPKAFLVEKQPRTDVERIACLAYYLTHYRDTPHFKTLELSKINTEAAQPKFANAANAANNAIKTGYLVPSTKGFKQLSAVGERFVHALPDREAAKTAMSSWRPRRRTRRPTEPSNKKQTP